MHNVIHRRNNCRSCESQNLELIFKLNPSPIGDAYIAPEHINLPQPSYPIDLYMCKSCGLAQLIDIIDPEILYGEYIYITTSSAGLSEHFQNYAIDVTEKCKLNPNSLVIDIGSNDGTLLKNFWQKGMNVLGIEPAKHIAAKANASGIKSIDKFFTTDLARLIVKEYGHAKLITANNVFANIDNLSQWVNAINELLDDDGIFVFESYYLADVIQNMVFDFIYHEHLSAFSVKPMQKLFQCHNLELAAVERVPTKGGSLRYFIQRPGGSFKNDTSVMKMLLFEENIKLYDKETFVTFTKKINNLKEQAKALLVLVLQLHVQL